MTHSSLHHKLALNNNYKDVFVNDLQLLKMNEFDNRRFGKGSTRNYTPKNHQHSFSQKQLQSQIAQVETIMDRDNFTLEELLDEDEIIQECKALNSRLINFLSGKAQVEQLVRYIIEEAPEDAEKKRTFKFPFIACEMFTCEVDNILKTLVEDEELMNLLFSFLEPNNSHFNLLAGYFSKVIACLMLRKTVPFMQYVQAHQEILKKLVELIGITSIMEVLILLIGANEHINVNHVDAMKWIENTDVLEMIVDKFSSSDSPEVHTNTAETLCAITRFAPAGLSAKISSPSFIGRLFCHALEDSRPKSVLVNSLSICISLLDPRRISFGAYHSYNRQMTNGSTVTANPETIEGMLESLGDLLKLLDVSSAENLLPTTYGKLQPPLGKHRLKIVEFISVLLTVGSKAAEKKLIDYEAVQRIINLFFKYPYNNFLHHHVENIIISWLESKSSSLKEHILSDCDFVGKIIQAEKHLTLEAGTNKPTSPAEGKSPPRIGSIGHLTRISNKLIQLGNTNSMIQEHLQGISEWTDWYMNVLSNRNAVENVTQWACVRPTQLHDRNRDSDEDDYQDRDYGVAALANNLSQAFRYGIYNNDDDMEEDVYFDEESAEVVISSLRLGEEPESGSLFTNSNWFAFEEDRDRVANERSTGSLASLSPNAKEDEIYEGLHLKYGFMQEIYEVMLKDTIDRVQALKTTGLVYKQRFEIESSNHAKAEAEVDLLGDEVETLLRLLERVYVALDHYSPILKHYPGMIEILKLVKRELTGESRPYAVANDPSFIVHMNPLYTN